MVPVSVTPAIARELEAMASATEGLGQQLCADPQLALQCLPLLQQFDQLAQQQAELATLLRRLGAGTPVEDALRLVRLDELAQRLRGRV